MELRIAFLPGDGVGPEVTASARTVLTALGARFGFSIRESEHGVGWAAVRAGEPPLPADTLKGCLEAEAVFLGAVGHPDAGGVELAMRPETGLLRLRSELGCWANLRPLSVWEPLVACSPLRSERVRGVDLLVVRELGGGLYYGEPRSRSGDRATNTLTYQEHEIRRIVELGFQLARGRRGHLTSVDKANVLEVSQLWRQVVDEVASRESTVSVDHMYVDRAAMEMVLNPRGLDVVVTSNLFGDILSDEAGALAGSLGVLGSASLGGVSDLYEPVHGSAPDLAGRGVANPVGAFASVALMMRHTYGMHDAADALEHAMIAVLSRGMYTEDLASAVGVIPVSTDTFTEGVVSSIRDREMPP